MAVDDVGRSRSEILCRWRLHCLRPLCGPPRGTPTWSAFSVAARPARMTLPTFTIQTWVRPNRQRGATEPADRASNDVDRSAGRGKVADGGATGIHPPGTRPPKAFSYQRHPFRSRPPSLCSGKANRRTRRPTSRRRPCSCSSSTRVPTGLGSTEQRSAPRTVDPAA